MGSNLPANCSRVSRANRNNSWSPSNRIASVPASTRMRICSLAAISTESARSNAGVLAANFIGAGVNPDTAVSRNELRMPRSRIPGSGAFVDRARRRGLGSCQTRGAWFATVCTHPTHVFQGGSCKGEEVDGASIRGHLVSSQFPWEVKFASVMSAPPFLGTSASAASKTATGNS